METKRETRTRMVCGSSHVYAIEKTFKDLTWNDGSYNLMDHASSSMRILWIMYSYGLHQSFD